MREIKTIPFEIKAKSDDGGSFSGYGSCFGVLDNGWDIVDPAYFDGGALGDFLTRGLICWQHKWDCPIGKPTDAKTDAKGLFLDAKLSDVTMGRDCRTLLKDDVIRYLSMGYANSAVQWLDGKSAVEDYWRSIGYNPTPEDLEAASYGARVLMKCKRLYEVSPVSFPMNDACDITASKADGTPAGRTFEAHSAAVLATCEEFIGRCKSLAELRQEEGRGLAPDKRALLKRLRDGFDALIASAEPKAEAADIDRLWMQFQETEARLKGVAV